MADSPLFTARIHSGMRLVVWPSRYEVEIRRASTLFLTKKRETYAFKSIRDIAVKGGNVTVHFGPLSVRNYLVGKRNAERLRQAWVDSL